jgi:hypothetical protein
MSRRQQDPGRAPTHKQPLRSAIAMKSSSSTSRPSSASRTPLTTLGLPGRDHAARARVPSPHDRGLPPPSKPRSPGLRPCIRPIPAAAPGGAIGDIALYTAENGRTTYITSGYNGWFIADATDPTQPIQPTEAARQPSITAASPWSPTKGAAVTDSILQSATPATSASTTFPQSRLAGLARPDHARRRVHRHPEKSP